MRRRATFQRARQPEHKLERRTDILDAARRLALRDGVANVTLGHIADAVGLAKSNVLRYFETREEIYLQLTAEGWRAWAKALAQRLGTKTRTASDVATVIAQTLVEVPLFAQLLGLVSANLERNVSADVVRMFKLEVTGLITQLAEVLTRVLPPATRTQSAEIISATVLIAGAAWPIAFPPPHLAALYATDPQMTAFCFDFERELRRLVLALVNGLIH